MNLTLYEDPLCPFCMRVKQYLKSVGLSIPMKNTMVDIQAYKELLLGGGRATVPCLQIKHDDGRVDWMYESLDIIKYIDHNRTELAQPSA